MQTRHGGGGGVAVSLPPQRKVEVALGPVTPFLILGAFSRFLRKKKMFFLREKKKKTYTCSESFSLERRP